jgi:hypothetical protein
LRGLPVIEKECTTCFLLKDINLFSRSINSPSGRRAACKTCQSQYNKKWMEYGDNRKRKYENAKWQAKLFKYNMTQNDYNSMLLNQDNKCKICDLQSSSNLHGHLYVDHCHSSNKVRGLLCKSCNSMLGMSKDSIMILEKAISYLKDSII